MFKIGFTQEAVEDIHQFRKTDRKHVIDEVERHLKHQPTQETRNRKKLRPNEIAEWELRVDKFRVFYDVDENEEFVKIEAVGFKKGSRIFIHGEEYKL